MGGWGGVINRRRTSRGGLKSKRGAKMWDWEAYQAREEDSWKSRQGTETLSSRKVFSAVTRHRNAAQAEGTF